MIAHKFSRSCHCPACRAPLVPAPPPPPPRQTTVFAERRPSTPAARPPAPVAPAAATPRRAPDNFAPMKPENFAPPEPGFDRERALAAVHATNLLIKRITADHARADADARLARFLALRIRGVARDKAIAQVDAEFTATATATTERERP